MSHDFDLVIRNGLVFDGTGADPCEGDVAIRGGRIAAVGEVTGRGREEFDARGKIVTPGFIDIHTHYDGQAVWDERLIPSSWHGVTTVVMGNCGVGFAPVRPGGHGLLIEVMEGVEDIPGTALHEGLDWNWESYDEYLKAIEAIPHDMDICSQFTHEALRIYVMGERAVRLEPATPEDIAEMRRLTAEAIRAGAFGFSTSRTVIHRTATGDPVPSVRAAEDELLGIAMGMKDAGGGVFQAIFDTDADNAVETFMMLRRVIEQSGRPMTFSLGQIHKRADAWRVMLRLVDEAVADGLNITVQVAPRPVAALFGLQSTMHPFSLCAAWLDIQHKTLAEQVAIMRDPAVRARLLREVKEPKDDHFHSRTIAYDSMYRMGNPLNYEPTRDDTVTSIAAREARDPSEVAYDLLLEDEGQNFLLLALGNYAESNLDVAREMMLHPQSLIGLGDGGAHVGLLCDASFPTYLLTHWARDRKKGRFDLTTLIHWQTERAAKAFGLRDRGTLKPGMKADVNIIDFAALDIERPVAAFDLPAGSRRLLQRARGYEATIVSGEIVYRNGEATGNLPGRLLRASSDDRLTA